jgi:hypothetical protein
MLGHFWASYLPHGPVRAASTFRQFVDSARMAAVIVEWADNALGHSFAS